MTGCCTQSCAVISKGPYLERNAVEYKDGHVEVLVLPAGQARDGDDEEEEAHEEEATRAHNHDPVHLVGLPRAPHGADDPPPEVRQPDRLDQHEQPTKGVMR
jgi:hypothetical protein